MIIGTHAIIYTEDAERARAFFRVRIHEDALAIQEIQWRALAR